MMKGDKNKVMKPNESDGDLSNDKHQLSREETTPRIRPWNQIQSNYNENNHHDRDHDSKDNRRGRGYGYGDGDENEDEDEIDEILQLPEEYQTRSDDDGEYGDEDEDGQLKSVSSSNNNDDDYKTQPMTPSRLLTISSVDFHDDNQQQQQQPLSPLGQSSHHSHHPQNKQSNFHKSINDPLNPPPPPPYPSDLTGEVNIDAELKYHDDLINTAMNQLNLHAQTHFQTILQKLISKYTSIIASKDDRFRQHLITHQQTLLDFQTLVTNYENKLEIQAYLNDKLKLNWSQYYLHRYYWYIGPFSLHNILHKWKNYIQSLRIYPRLTHIATSFHRKKILNRFFQSMSRYAIQSKYQRKYHLLATNSNQQMISMISKYETDITTLQTEIKSLFQLLQTEKVSKLQLEENLRRLFLKNLTVMNMNALSLFQDENGSSVVPELLWNTINYENNTPPLPPSIGGGGGGGGGGGAGGGGQGGAALPVPGPGSGLGSGQYNLEHEKYLIEKQQLREEMRVQQQELQMRQQQQAMPPSSSSSPSPSPYSHSLSSQQHSQPPQQQQQEHGNKIKRNEKNLMNSKQMTAPFGRSTKQPLTTNTTPTTTTKPLEKKSSNNNNSFTISGPSFHSKGTGVNESTALSSSSSSQQNPRLTSSSKLTTKTTMTTHQHHSSVISSSSSSSHSPPSSSSSSSPHIPPATTAVSSSSSSSRLDQKLFSSSAASIPTRPTPSSSHSSSLFATPGLQPSQLFHKPIPPPSHPQYGSDNEDGDDENPPQPRYGQGPEAIRST